MPNNNPFSDLASALGGAVFGDPRQQALGQFYGQRSRGQTLKNQALQTGIDEHDALMKSVAGNEDLTRALQGGEDYSSAKFNLGKDTRASNAEARLVDGLANLDPVLANQIKAGLGGTDIRALENIANDKSLNLAKVGEVDARTALDTQIKDQRGKLSDLLAGKMMQVPDGNGGFNQVPANILLPYLSGMTGAGSSSLLQTQGKMDATEQAMNDASAGAKQERKLEKQLAQLVQNTEREKTRLGSINADTAKLVSPFKVDLAQQKVEEVKAKIITEQNQAKAFTSLKEVRDSKRKIADWQAQIAKTKYGKHGLKSKEYLSAIKDAIKMFRGQKDGFGQTVGMNVEYKGKLVDARTLSVPEISEVAKEYVLGLTGKLQQEAPQPDLTNALGGVPQAPEPDLARALGGVSQGGVPQSVIAKLSNVKGAALEDLYKETRNLPDDDPLRKYVEQLYLGQ